MWVSSYMKVIILNEICDEEFETHFVVVHLER
jgi:hypothetical protein